MRAGLPVVLFCVVLAGHAAASGYSAFNAGIAASNRGDTDNSIRLLSEAIAAPDLSPRFLSAAYFIRGQNYLEKKQCDSVVADMTASLKLNPAQFEAYLMRGYCYALKKQNELVQADFTAAIGVRPDLAKGYMVRGVFYTESAQKFDAAIADFTMAVAIEPDNAETYELRGNVYRRQVKFDAALDDENKAIEIASKYAAAYFDRGLIYRDEGKFSDSADDFKKVTEISPDNAAAKLNIGLSQWEAGRFDDAALSLETAAKAAPGDAYWQIWLSLGRSKLAKTDDDLAQRTSKLDPAKWPGPVVSVFLGKMTVDQAVQAASLGDADSVPGQKCEADFYLGEWQLQHQNPSAAKTMLQEAANTCPHEFIEWPAASAEVKRLP